MTGLNTLRLFHWLVARYAMRHKWLAALNIASIALGVSVYLAIQIANHSADKALRAGVDLVAGKASLEVRGEIADTLFPTITQVPGVAAATPLVEATLTLPDYPGEYFRVLGVDPFTNQPFATFQIGDGGPTRNFDFEKWLTDPFAIAVSDDFAARYKLKIGDTITALVNSKRVPLHIAFVIKTEASLEGSGARIAAMDIAAAQQLFGLAGQITSIQLLTSDGQESAVAEKIHTLVPATVTVAPPAQRSAQVGQMLQAFQLNLSALSMVALLVGMFLVFNTVSASVVRRRHEIGILRSGGVSRGQIRGLFMGEALLYGVIGLLTGIVGGVLLSNLLVAAVGKTISSLYILLSIDQLFVSAPQILLTMVIGLGSVLVATWIPANEAAMLAPVAALNPGYELERSRNLQLWLPLAGLGLIGIAALTSWISLQRWPWLGFGSAFFLLAGCSLFAPLLTLAIAKLLQTLASSSLLFSLAIQYLRRSLSRISLTVAALGSAVAMMIGVSVMIYSFRQTINTWVSRSLVADVFIAPASNETIGLGAFMPPDAANWLRERSEVTAVDTFREMRLPFRDRTIRLSVVAGHKRDNLRFLEGDHARRNALLFQPDHVLVSEPFSRRYRLRAGDVMQLPTPKGIRSFVIGGTYYDYTSDEGTVLMARENFDGFWDDLRVNSLAVFLRSPSDYDELTDAFRKQFGNAGNFSLYSNSSIRQRVFEIFEQTFAVTSLLRIIAIGVAVIGIFLTLSTLVTERFRELAVLRSVGAGQGQICGMILIEGALVGLLASILGIITGCGLAVVLTFVVNKAFFGWTIQFAWPWTTLLTTPLWIVPAALLSALFPAWRASRLALAPALRNE